MTCAARLLLVFPFREFVQSIRDRHDLVKALTNIASWLLTSFVTVKLSEALQQSGSWVRRIWFFIFLFQTKYCVHVVVTPSVMQTFFVRYSPAGRSHRQLHAFLATGQQQRLVCARTGFLGRVGDKEVPPLTDGHCFLTKSHWSSLTHSFPPTLPLTCQVPRIT